MSFFPSRFGFHPRQRILDTGLLKIDSQQVNDSSVPLFTFVTRPLKSIDSEQR